MAHKTRPRAKTLFMRLLRRVPMPLLSLLIGLVVGLAVWGFLDRSQRAAVRHLFNQELQLRLDQRSRENLIRFDQYLENYATTTRLLANHRRLALYLEPLFWSLDDRTEPQRYEGFRPYWLPDLIGSALARRVMSCWWTPRGDSAKSTAVITSYCRKSYPKASGASSST